MIHDQLGSVVLDVKWQLKVTCKGKSALRCGVELMSQSPLSCLKARKGRQVPLGLGGQVLVFSRGV